MSSRRLCLCVRTLTCGVRSADGGGRVGYLSKTCFEKGKREFEKGEDLGTKWQFWDSANSKLMEIKRRKVNTLT